jgi:hypothetical protein
MHSLELIVATEHVSFIPGSHIRAGPIDIELDLEYHGQLKTSEVGNRFVRRIVDSLESMQFTPLCHTDPIRAELEPQ